MIFLFKDNYNCNRILVLKWSEKMSKKYTIDKQSIEWTVLARLIRIIIQDFTLLWSQLLPPLQTINTVYCNNFNLCITKRTLLSSSNFYPMQNTSTMKMMITLQWWISFIIQTNRAIMYFIIEFTFAWNPLLFYCNLLGCWYLRITFIPFIYIWLKPCAKWTAGTDIPEFIAYPLPAMKT